MIKIIDTIKIWAFGLLKIPLIAYCRPQVINLDDRACEIKIPLNYFTKNHLGSMYFGALSVGADLAGGTMALSQIEKSGKKIDLVFKDFKADFLKRPMDDVHFYCEDGGKIKRQIDQVIKTGKRVTKPITILARVPRQSMESVARFVLGLSLKQR